MTKPSNRKPRRNPGRNGGVAAPGDGHVSLIRRVPWLRLRPLGLLCLDSGSNIETKSFRK